MHLPALVVVMATQVLSSHTHTHKEQHFNFDPEIYMNTTALITNQGYPCENHYVTTLDGFILNLQRIPHGRSGEKAKHVVMLQHGLLGSSNNFVLNPANESLAFILADAGADVWLGNVRGNTYSRSHRTLTPSDDLFWEFSFDEMAKLDLPAMIDYITRTTSTAQIMYIGHSQGTMIGFAGFSQNKTLGRMVKTFVALAPVARVGRIRSPLRFLAPFAKDLEFFDQFGHGEFLPSKNLTKWLGKDVCGKIPAICESFSFVIGGFDYKNVNMTRVPVYISHTPSGTSVQNMMHFAQEVNSDKFVMFDYGSVTANMDHYGQITPPLYRPGEMEVPVVLFHGGKDFLADPEDVTWIRSQLKNVVGDHFIQHWEHFDFILALDAPKLCYEEIKRLMLK